LGTAGITGAPVSRALIVAILIGIVLAVIAAGLMVATVSLGSSFPFA
jgi:hypothetical protein